MAEKDTITTKFKVDISDLKKGIAEANNQIKLANSVFKSASDGTKEWENSAEGLKAKLTQLKSVLEAQTAKLNIYKNQLQTAQKYEKEASANVTQLKAALEKAKSAYGENSDEVKKLEQELSKAEQAEQAMKQQVQNLTVTMNNQQGTVNKTATQMNKLESELDQLENAEKSAKTETDKLDKSLDDVDKTARTAGGGFTVFKGALANLISSGIQSVVGEMRTLVGEAIDAMDALYKFEQTMGFAGYDSKTIEKAKNDVKQYADETVYDLETVSNTTAQLAANGISDYTGLTKAAGNLNAVAGGSAETFKSVAMMLTQTAGAGKLTTENWNQLTDAIPGASGRLQEALLKAGAYTGNFREAMEKGEITAEEFNAAIMELGNEPVAVEAAKSVETFEGAMGNLRATVVSGMMEIIDAIGMENITGFIVKVTDAIAGLMPMVKEFVQFVIDNIQVIGVVIGSVVAAIAVGKIVSIITTIRTAILLLNGAMLASEASTKAVTLANNLNTVALVAKKVALVATTVATKAATAAQWLWNAAMTANPIGIMVVAIAALVAGITALTIHLLNEEKAIKSTTEAQEALTEAKNKAKEAEDTYIDAVDRATQAQKALEEAEESSGESGKALFDQVEAGTLTYADMTEAQREVYKAYVENQEAQKALEESTRSFNEAKKAETIASYENQLALAAESGNYDEFKKSVVDAFKKGELSADEARDLIGKSMSEMSRDSQQTFMEDLPSDIKNGLNPKNYETHGQKLSKWFSSLGSNISKGFSDTWAKIKQAWAPVKDWFNASVIQPVAQFFTNFWKNVTTQASNALTAIKIAWNTIVEFFKTLWTNVLNIVSTTWSSITNLIKQAFTNVKNVWNAITAFFSNLWSNVKNTTSSAWSSITNVIKQSYTNVRNAWSGITGFFSGIWNSVVSGASSAFNKLVSVVQNVVSRVKSAWSGLQSFAAGVVKGITNGWNTMVSGLKSAVNVAIDGINGAIGIINAIPGVNIGVVPRLAQGGILKKGQVGLLEGNGAEAVVPLERNKHWINKVAEEMMRQLQSGSASNIKNMTNNTSNNFTQNIYAPKQPSRIELYRQTKNLLNLKGAY